MSFIEVNIVTPDTTTQEIFTAELAELGFDTFEETSEGLYAYISKDAFDQASLGELAERYATAFTFDVHTRQVEKENWNKKWEENYDPIAVGDRCIVRATFHNIEKKYPYEIVISPKMSFGTGHHATTWQMLLLQMDIDFANKSVLDVGSGTGVLAIMAHKLRAERIVVTDVDDWCIENSNDNFALNGMTEVESHKGKIADLSIQGKFDIILANINKNVLLDEIPEYASLVKDKGMLLLSGFYDKDMDDIKKMASNYNLKPVKAVTKDSWTAGVFVKS
ncbi:MAG: 50S ribosomal protein L11 methyltransferase [Cyclobacteriaceae bacterium]